MNPIRPLLRSALRLPLARPSTSNLSRLAIRSLTVPTLPTQAQVSDVTPDTVRGVREDPGEFEEGDVVADAGKDGEGESELSY